MLRRRVRGKGEVEKNSNVTMVIRLVTGAYLLTFGQPQRSPCRFSSKVSGFATPATLFPGIRSTPRCDSSTSFTEACRQVSAFEEAISQVEHMTLRVVQISSQGIIEPRSLPRAEGQSLVRAVILDSDEDVKRLLSQGGGRQSWKEEFLTLIATRYMGCEKSSFDYKYYKLGHQCVWVCRLVAGDYECFGVAFAKKVATNNACFNLMSYWSQPLEELNFVGAGPPERVFRWSQVVSRGTGGKSKVKRDPEADPLGVEAAQKVVEKDRKDGGGPTEKSVCEIIVNEFMCSAPPQIKMLFNHPSHADTPIDLEGHPFCGLVCIDTAAGVRPDVKTYTLLVPEEKICTPEEVVGTPEYLGRYARSRGYNLRILHPAQTLFGRTHTDYYGGYSEWIVIRFIPCESGIGHYVLMCEQAATESGFHIASLPAGVTWSILPRPTILWLLASLLFCVLRLACYRVRVPMFRRELEWLSCATGIYYVAVTLLSYSFYWENSAKSLGRVSLPNNVDVRTIQNRRERIVHQDSFLRVQVGRRLCVSKYAMFLIPVVWVYRFVRYIMGYNEFVMLTVSEPLYNTVATEMENIAVMGLDPKTALSSLSRFREVNTPAAVGVITDTAILLKMFAAGLAIGHQEVPDIGWVPVAAPGLTSYVPNLDTVAKNQLDGIKGRGKHFMDKPNHVLKYTLKESKGDNKIGVYPIGCLHTPDGRVGPGLFSVTNSVNTLAAFCGRAMSKDLSERAQRNVTEYLLFALGFLRFFIDSVEAPGEEPDSVLVFREHYKGKRSAKWIEKCVQDYDRYRAGLMCAKEEKKFKKNGFFVKFEHNTKNGKPRPRGIMTMSALMLMLCCPILVIIHLWNCSPFSKFQVKSMSPQETFDKIMGHTDEPYSVSDYSAFESSIDQYIRLVESYVICELCDRFGWKQTKRSYLRFTLQGRELSTKWGKFYIGTRCSGDFWTSFGNGIVNVTVMAFCAHKKGLELTKMLAEGDDGLVPSHIPDPAIINSLGLGFSSELKGTQDGDCDFLRKRVVAGKAYLPVGKALGSSLFVKKGHKLKRSKQLAILRNMAHSLYHQSPGHPILSALVNRIWKETSGISNFKGMDSYLKEYWDRDFVDPRLKRIEVDVTMRGEVARGAAGFASFSESVQMDLENRLENWPIFYVGRLLDEDEDFMKLVKSTPRDSSVLSTEHMDNLIDVANVCECSDEVRVSLRNEITEYVDCSVA